MTLKCCEVIRTECDIEQKHSFYMQLARILKEIESEYENVDLIADYEYRTQMVVVNIFVASNDYRTMRRTTTRIKTEIRRKTAPRKWKMTVRYTNYVRKGWRFQCIPWQS